MTENRGYMEDARYLSDEDKAKLQSLIKELADLKVEHKAFASKKSAVTEEERVIWRANSKRTNEVNIEIKDLRHKNILEAARG